MLNFARAWPVDDVAGLVADVDRGEFEIRCLELRAAWSSGSSLSATINSRDIRHRVRRAMRIGDMALDAVDVKHAVQ